MKIKRAVSIAAIVAAAIAGIRAFLCCRKTD
jgi:hypothetical protein